jgi:hypothetical protein
MSSYILRDLPPELWARARERAAREGLPLRPLLLELLEEYATSGKRPRVLRLQLTCAKCSRAMMVDCEAGGAGFGQMTFHRIDCPSCHAISHPQLPGSVVDVRACVDAHFYALDGTSLDVLSIDPDVTIATMMDASGRRDWIATTETDDNGRPIWRELPVGD